MINMPRSIAIIVGLFVGLIVIPLAHGVLPWAPLRAWHVMDGTEGSPGYWNWIGLIVVVTCGRTFNSDLLAISQAQRHASARG